MRRLSLLTSVLLIFVLQVVAAEFSNYGSAALEASAVVKASGGRIIQLIGYNSSGSDQFIQLHNSATLPSNGAVPFRSFKVIAGKNFSLDIPDPGLAMSTGIVVCNSSTSSTKTIGSADCLFYVIYQ
jgi:hypothetical protein